MKIVKYIYVFLMISFSLSAQEFKEYKIQKGETLKEVADKFEVSYLSLLRANKGVSRRPEVNTLVKVPTEFYKKGRSPLDPRSNNENDLFQKKTISQDSIGKHVVKAQETLYSLSKQYNIGMAVLIKNNKFLTLEGLKIGQELQIPMKKKSVAVVSEGHIVKAQETLYSISKQYKVSISDLKYTNYKELSEGLKIGALLKIPEIREFKKPLDSKKHLISKGETLYSISRQYGISTSELLALNKKINIDSLPIGSVLNLPKRVVAKVGKESIAPIYKQIPITHNFKQGSSLAAVLRDYHVSKDSLQKINPLFDEIIIGGGELLIGFEKKHLLFQNYQVFKDPEIIGQSLNALILLPFNFTQNDSLSKNQLFKKDNSLPSIVADFYMGAEMAIDSLKRIGVNLNVAIVDTEKTIKGIQKNLASLNSFHPDVIIGPMYAENVEYVANKYPLVPVYYPIDSKKTEGFNNANLYKTVTKKKLYKKSVLSYIKENRRGQHLIIVGGENYMNDLKLLKKTLVKKHASGDIIKGDVTILTPEKGYISKDNFLKTLKLEQDNWILITENNNVISADVFNNVKSIPRDSILETPIKIISYEKLNYTDEVSYQALAKYQYTYGTDKVEYTEFLTQGFEEQFLKKNNSYPNNNAIKGFNVTFDAVLRSLKGIAEDSGKASHRYKQAFYYENKNEEAINENQAVFVNTIENKKEGLKIIRLR